MFTACASRQSRKDRRAAWRVDNHEKGRERAYENGGFEHIRP